MKLIVPALVTVLLLAGCSTHSTVKPFATRYGESAVTIANHINGCSGVAIAAIGGGARSGMVSAATCTLKGRKITVDSWADADSADLTNLMTANNAERYWAEGAGWSAFETDDSQIQLQLTNDAGTLLKSAIDGSQPTADIDGEKAAATSIAKSLHGHVSHYRP